MGLVAPALLGCSGTAPIAFTSATGVHCLSLMGCAWVFVFVVLLDGIAGGG